MADCAKWTTLTLIENLFDTNHIFQIKNYIDAYIKFTFELEDSVTFPFLHVSVIKCNSS